MTRIKNICRTHFRNPADAKLTLCGIIAGERTDDLFREAFRPWDETTDRVNCPDCAKVVCACRNECYNTLINEVDENAMMRGMFAAVGKDGRVEEGQ